MLERSLVASGDWGRRGNQIEEIGVKLPVGMAIAMEKVRERVTHKLGDERVSDEHMANINAQSIH